MNTQVNIQVGSRVHVSFTSESRTEFSNQLFEGEGTVDLFDDLYVMGRLDTGLPFMCGYADLTVIEFAPIVFAEDENQITEDKVISAIQEGAIFMLDGIVNAIQSRGFDFSSYCSCDLDAEAEEARKLTLIELIERINTVGLKDALEELRRDGFMLGAHIDCKKLES